MGLVARWQHTTAIHIFGVSSGAAAHVATDSSVTRPHLARCTLRAVRSAEQAIATKDMPVRRLPSVLLLAALALTATAFAPAPRTAAPRTGTPQPVAAEDARQIVVCVKFQEWTIPVVGYTWEPEYERFCVEAPDVNPDMLPVPGDSP